MRKASAMTIDLRSRKNGVYQFGFSPSAESTGLDPLKFHDIGVEGSISIANAGTHVQFSATAVATLECDRTLFDFDQTISGIFHGLVAEATDFDELTPDLKKSDANSGRSNEGGSTSGNPVDSLQAADVDLVPMYGGVVVLDAVVRDTLMLAIPMRKISPQAAAMEMNLEYGKNEDGNEEQIDPRWEALKRLRNDDEK